MSLINSQTQHLFINPSFEITDLKKCTHLAIGAHPDDLEIMAGHGILEGQKPNQAFVGITCTDGAGSLKQGSEEELIATRKQEQLKAAELGDYLACALLNYKSSSVKNFPNKELIEDFKNILKETEPDYIYSHNPMDKHGTHVGVCLHLLEALKQMSYQPKAFYGCEVWRGLDWIDDSKKQHLPIEEPQKIAELIDVFQSQLGPGKNYTQATLGRFQANGTYNEAMKSDQFSHVVYAVDLLPLLNTDVLEFVESHTRTLSESVKKQITNIRS